MDFIVIDQIIIMSKTLLGLGLVILCLSFVNATVVPHLPPIHSHVPRTYKVALEDSPQKRWAPIINDYKEPLAKFMQYFNELPIPETFYEGVEYFAKNVYSHKDFVAEVDAVSKLSGYPFDKLFFINFMYEYSTFKACTGILVCNSEGKVLHGRNLDFEMWNLLSNLLVHVEFYKGGKKLFNSDIVVGSVFALTGSKPGAFAVNVDTRYAKDFVDDLVSVLKNDAIPTCWLLRKVLEEESSFDSAVKRLKGTRIGGPVYYIISGINPYEGMVIERDVDAVHAYYELSETNWFLVQTNYDRDYPDPLHDPRRVPVEQRLRERGNVGLGEQELLDEFMFVWPTLNIATIMSAIMVSANGYHNTTAWYGSNPTNSLKSEY